MSEAPKKIWLDKDYLTVGFERIDDRDTLYIRADLIDDEWVEALENMVNITECSGNIVRIARAALKKLEKNND